MDTIFNTPLRSAALGIMIVAVLTMLRGLLLGNSYRLSVLVLAALAVCLVLISEALQ